MEWQTVSYKKKKNPNRIYKPPTQSSPQQEETTLNDDCMPEPLHYKCKKYEYA